MSRFLLDDETIERISTELPDLERSGTSIMMLAPDFISMKYPAESNVPVAAVCLQDTLETLLQVRIGLNECLQHQIWFQEKCDPPNEELAIIFMRFYIDGIVSRLYAAGEHLANSIICMLEITESQIEEYRKRRVSQQSIIGQYLVNELGNNPITKAVLELVRSKEWNEAMAYRRNLIHAQPPTVGGLGPVYKRRKRWIQSHDGKSVKLGLGGGDEADYSIDEILEFVQPAVFAFVDLFNKIVGVYIHMISRRGVIITPRGLQTKLFEKPPSTQPP